MEKKDVSIYKSEKDLRENYNAKYIIKKVKYGRIYLDYDSDTIIIKIGQNIPIIFKGLNKIKRDTLKINHIPLTNYLAIDTLSVYSVKYYNKDSIDKTTEKKHISFPNNSKRISKKLKKVAINKIEYPLTIISERYELETWSCTHGKKASRRSIKGINKYYILEI